MPTLTEIPENWTPRRIGHGTTTDPKQGAMRTAALFAGDRREFALMWETATDGIRSALDTLHASTLGGALTMDWTPPGEADAIAVRFLPGRSGYDVERLAFGVYRIQVNLMEAPEHRTPSAI